MLEKNVQLKGISIIRNGSVNLTKEVGSRNEGRINGKELFPDWGRKSESVSTCILSPSVLYNDWCLISKSKPTSSIEEPKIEPSKLDDEDHVMKIIWIENSQSGRFQIFLRINEFVIIWSHNHLWVMEQHSEKQFVLYSVIDAKLFFYDLLIVVLWSSTGWSWMQIHRKWRFESGIAETRLLLMSSLIIDSWRSNVLF